MALHRRRYWLVSFLHLTSHRRTPLSLYKDARGLLSKTVQRGFTTISIFLFVYGSTAAPGPFVNLVSSPSSHVLTAREIHDTTIFEQPLVPTGDPTDQENQALFQALKRFSQRTVRDDFSSLTGFLRQFPDSVWAPALEVQLGREFYRVGRYSKAILAWKHVWESQRPETSATSSMLINEAGSELGMMYARLGRMPELRSLLNKLQGQPEHGKLTRQIRGATDGLWSMDNKPEVSFRCGPLALDRILFATDRAKAGSSIIENSQSTTNGFSVRQVAELSRQLGMHYQVAFRTPGTEILLPAVVHWKVGHYAALIARDGALLRAEDPTFGMQKIWLSDDALDSEASGYFLVRAGPLPAGWREVSDAEADRSGAKDRRLAAIPITTRIMTMKTRLAAIHMPITTR